MTGDEIDQLIAKSSVGAGLADIKARGIDAHLVDLEQEMAPKKKRRKSTSPTQRTLGECRKRGWTVQVVERRLPRTFTTVDLFGVIDLVAIVPAEEIPGLQKRSRPGAILGIQATSATNHASRRAKILAEPRARQWVEAGGRLEIWSWALQGARGKRKRWQVRIETYAEMLAGAES